MQKSELQICGPIREGSLHGERRIMDLTQSHKAQRKTEKLEAPAPNFSDLVSLCESSRDSEGSYCAFAANREVGTTGVTAAVFFSSC